MYTFRLGKNPLREKKEKKRNMFGNNNNNNVEINHTHSSKETAR